MNNEQENIDEALLLRIIEDKADDAEVAVFQAWKNASKEHAELFAQMKKVHQLSSFDRHSTKANWGKVVNKVRTNYQVPDSIELPEYQNAGKGMRLNILLRIAAVITLAIGVTYLFKNIVFNHEQLIVSGIELAKDEPYQMADGSLVYLNGNSEISFQKSFNDKNREVTLKGEAFFEIEKNENLPFVIITNNTKTEVVGTSFNIFSQSSGEVKVSVVTGVVRFYSDKANDVELRPGEQAMYDPITTGIEKANINNPNFLAWKTGTIVFKETPLDEALETLSQYYSQVLLFKGAENNTPNITNTFDNQPLEAVLEELNLLLNTKHLVANDTIVFEIDHK